MNVLILGVATGTKVQQTERDNFRCEVTILTKSKDISYAVCGLPYYVGNLITEQKI